MFSQPKHADTPTQNLFSQTQSEPEQRVHNLQNQTSNFKYLPFTKAYD